MAHGTRGRWLRVATAGFGVMLCTCFLGCLHDDKPKDTKAGIKQGLPGTPKLDPAGNPIGAKTGTPYPYGNQYPAPGANGYVQPTGAQIPPAGQGMGAGVTPAGGLYRNTGGINTNTGGAVQQPNYGGPAAVPGGGGVMSTPSMPGTYASPSGPGQFGGSTGSYGGGASSPPAPDLLNTPLPPPPPVYGGHTSHTGSSFGTAAPGVPVAPVAPTVLEPIAPSLPPPPTGKGPPLGSVYP